MDKTQAILTALDQLVATLRSEQDLRLAAILYHQLHQASWPDRSALFGELHRLLSNTQASQVSCHSVATSAHIDEILSALAGLS